MNLTWFAFGYGGIDKIVSLSTPPFRDTDRVDNGRRITTHVRGEVSWRAVEAVAVPRAAVVVYSATPLPGLIDKLAGNACV